MQSKNVINFEPTGVNIQFIQAICFLVTLYCIIFSAEWYWYVVSVVAYGINVLIGLSFTMHRLYSHKCFQTFPIIEKILSLHACLSMVGSPLSYSYIHRFHHANSDNNTDPHSPKHGILHSIFGLHQPQKLHAFIIRDFIKDKFQMYIHKYYLLIVIVICSIIGLCNFQLLLFGVLMPGFFASVASRLNNWVTHEAKFGVQNIDTGDNSRNVGWWNVLLLWSGEGWANNHHYCASKYDFGKPQGRIDIIARIIDAMAIVRVVKVK